MRRRLALAGFLMMFVLVLLVPIIPVHTDPTQEELAQEIQYLYASGQMKCSSEIQEPLGSATVTMTSSVTTIYLSTLTNQTIRTETIYESTTSIEFVACWGPMMPGPIGHDAFVSLLYWLTGVGPKWQVS